MKFGFPWNVKGIRPEARVSEEPSPLNLDYAIARITARRHALTGAPARVFTTAARPETAAPQPAMPAPTARPEKAPVSAPTPEPPPLSAKDLSGFENQFRRITDQIETLRQPGIERAVNALRDEIGAMAHTLNQAMPRQAIDAIETRIAALNKRIAEGRQAGVDKSVLARIEHGLADIREALRALTPAENLVVYNETIAGLAKKIDLFMAQKDPVVFQQLESAITTLRGMVAHVASNDTVSQLAAKVQALGEKIDRLALGTGGNDALTHIDQRVAALADAMTESVQNGNMASPQLEVLVHSLSEKIEQVQSSHGNDVALGHLEDRIVTLVQKLDASESRLGQLEAIERGLSDLLVHVGEMRASNKQAEMLHADTPSAKDDLKQEIARTHDALENVHSTLGLVVDRLAMIEQGIRKENHARMHDQALALPVGKLVARVDDNLTDSKPVAPPPQPQRRAATSLPIVPDQPLEPGSGPPKFSDRIAASQAALGEAAPSVDALSGKSNFIAAARRAAQAAMQQAPAAAVPSIAPKLAPDEDEQPSLRGKMMKRMKSLVIAASIMAIVLGSFQIVGSHFKLDNFHMFHKSDSAKTGGAGKTAIASNSVPPPRPFLAAQPTMPAKPLALSPTPLTATADIGAPPLSAKQTGQQVQSLPSTPLLGPPTVTATTRSDITGSIPETAVNDHSAAGKTAPAVRNELPLAIGGPRLRKAALANDADADYEVGLRFAEGRGVPVNLPAAAHWFALAAHQGLAPAQFRYASMLEKGQGVNKNLEAARRLYLAAAEQGHAKAMHNLAVLYAEGANGKPDYVSAVKWFRKAAQHGIADSQYNLGVLTARGMGTAQNYTASYKWFALAAAHGDKESAKKCDEIATHLDAKELAAAKQAVVGFKIVPQPLAATIVPKPQGGWDAAKASAAPAKAGVQPTHLRRLPPHSDAHVPLPLDSFAVGNR